jgi:hypothetical protein
MLSPIHITNPETYVPGSYTVYWVHEAVTPGNPNKEGYIGITSYAPDKRING